MRKGKIFFLLTGFALMLVTIFMIYRNMAGISVSSGNKKNVLLIPTGSSYQDVYASIDSIFGIENPKLFNFLAKRKKYTDNIKAGRYVIEQDMSYNDLINLLRSGRQSPVNITFNNIRTLNQLAGKIGGRIESDSVALLNFLLNEENYKSDGFKKEEIIAVFIPNTYQMYWTTNPKGLYQRMLKEYRTFWNEQRLVLAKKKGLTPMEVSVLASIVDDEVAKKDEKPRIAGVYLNRIRIGMPLQACPTIRFALNDFTITRVLHKHLLVDSPYNTYKHRGLPPGPVGCPSIEGLESVLNAEDHDYLYFAAKADFSGYHNFARNLSGHNRNAALYQKELNRLKIFK